MDFSFILGFFFSFFVWDFLVFLLVGFALSFGLFGFVCLFCHYCIGFYFSGFFIFLPVWWWWACLFYFIGDYCQDSKKSKRR